MSGLDEYAAEVVSRLPSPPRAISTKAILWRVYSSTEGRWLLVVGLVLGLPATLIIAFVVEGELWAKLTGLAIVLPTTLALLGAPAIGGLRLARALAHGIKVRGEILRGEWQAPEARATIQALSHGMTHGQRRVFHPAGRFDQVFESDSRWARDLEPGRQVALLAHPTERRVYFDLGPWSE